MKSFFWTMAALTLVLVYVISKPTTGIPPEQISKIDTQILETWCGESTGTIRMVGAWYYDKNTFKDETGNLWGWDNIDEQAFYLLWIDDMGTPGIEDDEILKVWQERG